jgi:hypothetical protein
MKPRRRGPGPACAAGQRRSIDPLSAEHIDVEELGELLGRECFRRTERHVSGIVDYDVEATRICDDLGNARLHRFSGRDIEFDGSQIDPVLGGVMFSLGHLRSVATGCLAHGGVDDVRGLGERSGGKRAEAGGRASDDDDLFHDIDPSSDG